MANKVYTHSETATTFGHSNGLPTVTMDEVLSLPNGSGCQSAVWDLTALAHASLFRWQAKVICGATPIVGSGVDIYLSTSDNNTTYDGGLTSGHAGLGDFGRTRDLQYVGTVDVDRAATGVPFVKSGLVEVFSRYAMMVPWNNTGGALSSNNLGNDFLISLTPVPDELQ